MEVLRLADRNGCKDMGRGERGGVTDGSMGVVGERNGEGKRGKGEGRVRVRWGHREEGRERRGGAAEQECV